MSKKKIICFTLLVEKSPQALPLGAACIASSLKSENSINKNFNVELKDYSLEDKMFNSLVEDEIASKIADLLLKEELFAVCFSVYVWNRIITEKIASYLKQKNPEIQLICGGPEVTANPLSFKNFDFVVSGQGEESVKQLILSLINNQKIPNRIIYSVAPKLDELTSPYLDGTIDIKKYGGVLWELARGCPFKCSYCFESKGENRIQYFSQERIENEIKLFQQKNVGQVFVLDPTYNANKGRAIKMLRLIQKHLPTTYFYFEARAEFIDRELAREFAKINCSLQFGLQSTNPESLRLVNRTFDKAKFTKNIGILNEEGVIFGFDLIYGLPGDNFISFKQSVDYALSLYPNNLELFKLSILPGTVLYEQASQLHIEAEKTAPYHVIKTKSFSPEDLAKSEILSKATNIFYNLGRAVPWFNSVIFPLRIKPTLFLNDFAFFLETVDYLQLESEGKDMTFDQIKELQKLFVTFKYKEHHIEKMLNVALDLIEMNGALSALTGENQESKIKLHYHPDDLMSEYATDIQFFAKNCKPYVNVTKVFYSKNGLDWKVVKN